MSSAASSRRSSIRPSPASSKALETSSAAWESPDEDMTAACFTCSALGEGGAREIEEGRMRNE